MTPQQTPARWRILLAFATIYFVWGSTYLAIRVGVAEAPPFLFAGARFLIAGLVLLAWTLARKTALHPKARNGGAPWGPRLLHPKARKGGALRGPRLLPTAREWRGLLLLAALIFVCDYGLLFWAEQRVASGIAAVIMATIPIFIGLLEILFLRTQRLTARLGAGFLVGFGGVALVMSRGLSLVHAHGGATFSSAPGGAILNAPGGAGAAAGGEWKGYAALLVASLSWSVATILTRKVALPASKMMSAAAQMTMGGTMLLIVAAALGEYHGFRVQSMTWPAWLAFGYLIAFGSIAGFTTYVWLIHHESPIKVGTYAYVNPVVAVILGSTLGGEAIGGRGIAGMLLVLASVALITTTRAAKGTAAPDGAAGAREGEQEPQAAEP